jgi:Mn2+/Fe2+ NRAMP family transporter
MLLSSDRRIMGDLVSGHGLLAIGWASTIVFALMSIVLVYGFFVPLS